MFEKTPVYSDTTLEPYSELCVPVGNGRMRVYERRRDRELAGTTGSHVLAFPVASPSVPAPRERAVGTAGTVVPRVASESAMLPDRARPRRTSITAVPHTNVAKGVWLEFNGARWYSKGPASSFWAERFEPVGRVPRLSRLPRQDPRQRRHLGFGGERRTGRLTRNTKG